MRLSIRFLFVLLLLAAPAVFAQRLTIPEASPHARIEETVGITDIAVDYHRPAVNDRQIWGGLVAYDVIWRAGANDPTLVSFSTPVKVEGQPLAAGTYSFFLIPGQETWTAVFNRFTGGWGTYAYDEAEDVLRVKVTAQPAEMQERLLYSIDDATNDAASLSMRWEKLRVPVKITVDTKTLVAASIKAQLRSELHWDPQAWGEAAMFSLRGGDLDAALGYVDHALAMLPNAQNYRIKSRILERKGDAAGAKQAAERAAQMAAPDMIARSNAYSLLVQKKYDEAAAVIQKALDADAKSWRMNVAMGDLHAAKGDRAKAQEWFAKAMALAPTQSERAEVQDSINSMMAEGSR
ncbi:MAG: DUF2911 domain-containing protein [Thermoanaerobaculia bacterium]